ncbi:carbohydrate kinase family protein [Atopomonas sediminilitoris]|uniref:carbohydrate kinase family protein n=1 Tax=Atopomonas sediminilitoris TaxID=2919919 RepID=UPI001F4D9F60|nr:carbohydrate kinase family protein [Atopomonas sediminilitoris]MCJ8169551.1 carbohydrate kinase family protein [Atopomonas sediminilitoris]
MQPLCVIGGTSWDTLIHLPALPKPIGQTLWAERSYQTLGSTGAGKALNLTALGFEVSLHSVIGADAAGDAIHHALAPHGLHQHLARSHSATQQHTNLMDAHGQRLSIFTHAPAASGLDLAACQQALAACDLAIINILDYARPTLALAQALGKPIWTDLHDYDLGNPYHQAFIDAAEVILVADNQLRDYRAFMQQCIDQGKKLVLCTHAEHGASLLAADGTWLVQPALPIQHLRDSNGAGDAFFSGFVYGYLQQRPLAECLRLAAAAGAFCVESASLCAAAMTPTTLQQRAALQTKDHPNRH